MSNNIFNGWAVAGVAVRENDVKFECRLRAFSVSCFHKEDAEQYAFDEMARDYPPSDGWIITLATHMLTSLRVIEEMP